MARRPGRQPIRLEEHDLAAGIVLLRLDRRPQTAEATADDHEIRFVDPSDGAHGAGASFESSQNESGMASA